MKQSYFFHHSNIDILNYGSDPFERVSFKRIAISVLFFLCFLSSPVYSSGVEILGWFVNGQSVTEAYQGETVVLVGDLDGEVHGKYRVVIYEKSGITQLERGISKNEWNYTGSYKSRFFCPYFEVPSAPASGSVYFAKVFRFEAEQWTLIYTQEDHRLKIVKVDNWRIDVVDQTTFNSYYDRPDISVDKSGIAYIVYPKSEISSYGIYIAKRIDVGQWEKEMITANVTSGPSIAFDSQNRPRVFVPGGNGGVLYTKTESWTSETVTGYCAGQDTYFSDIAIGKEDRPHIVFGTQEICAGVIEGRICELAYRVQSSYSQWTYQPFFGAYGETPCGWWPSIAMDASDNIFIVHSGGGINFQKGKRTNVSPYPTWERTVIIGSGQSASVAVDSHSVPHVSYITDEKLKYAYWNGTKWITQTIAHDCLCPDKPAAIAIGLDGNPCVCFFDKSTNTLRLTRRISKPEQAPTTLQKPRPGQSFPGFYVPRLRWTTPEVIDSFMQTNNNPSISMVIDKAGIIHITYFDGFKLKYARTVPRP